MAEIVNEEARIAPPRNYLPIALLLIGLFYLGNYNGIWTSNDGSHFALVKAIVERGTFKLGPGHLRYTLGIDFALNSELEIYSDRPPGTAIVLTPFYALGRALSWIIGSEIIDPEDVLRFTAALGILFFALLNVTFVYWGSRLLGASARTALAGCIIFATTGLAFKYSTLMFSHTPGVTTTLLGACLLLSPLPEKRWRLNAILFGGGFVMGYAVLIEYQNVFFSAIFFVAWLYRLFKENKQRHAMPLIVGGAIPAIFLAIYHKTIFGEFITSTHKFNPMMAHNRDLGGIFSGSLRQGLYDIFLNSQMGILILSPIFLLGLWGLWKGRRSNALALVPLIAAILYTLFISRHTTITGGATNDCRYFFPVVALLALGIAPAIMQLLTWQTAQRNGALLLLSGLAVYSFVATFYVTINQKIDLVAPAPLWKTIVVKYGTLTRPDNNIDRLGRLFVLPKYSRFDADYVILPLGAEPYPGFFDNASQSNNATE